VLILMVSKKVLLGTPIVLAAVGYLGMLAYENKAMLKQVMEMAEEKIKDAGHYNVSGYDIPLAPLYILLTYTLATVFVLPLFGFHTLCGYVYGTIPGALIVSFSQMIGASCAFGMCRFFLRGPTARFLKSRWGSRYEAMDKALGKSGFKIVTLLRLSPVVPFSLTNYISACTSIELYKFAPATWLGIAPGTTFYCSLGAVGKMMKDSDGAQESISPIKIGLIVVGLIATGFLLKYIADIATNALKEAGVGNEDEDKKSE